MRKTLAAILGSALIVASSLQMATAAEHPAESHRHIRIKHVALRARSHVVRDVDSFACYNGMRDIAVPAVRPVNPGDPGNPYLNDSFDRSVARHQYNGS